MEKRMWRDPPCLVLASGSPRRKQLLSELGWKFQVIPADVDEAIFPGEDPETAACRLAEAKAREVSARMPESLVIGADTLVLLDGYLLGKPENRTQEKEMLRMLNGREHAVLTGIALVEGTRSCVAVERTGVRFRFVSESALQTYVDTGEGDDKAGGYAIQGQGALLVESISGCYYNVVGLPLGRLSTLLAQWGWGLSSQWGGKT
ncbi:MAG TPA: Maf family protein [Synergistaceae bacterium]|nr:Maf family protein [Synergistaceae bacterium]HPJ24707.1 Maf family protein [Synergistaceae bacterium]HPQ37287.1 Maf family protein [Synergistaceae bacterium]